MIIREVYPEEKDQFNKVVTHPLQSWQWGEFREKTGVKVIRISSFEKKTITSGFQITIHTLPKTNYTVGYLPKCTKPNQEMFQAFKKIGEDYNCIFIKLEPNLTEDKNYFSKNCTPGRPLFTKYTFQMDLTKSEENLLSQMKQKTRYNVRLAQKNGVKVKEDNSLETFQTYLNLTFKTTKRQKFYAHNKDYHEKMWKTLFPAGIAHLLKADYKGNTLAAWILFTFNNTLYYPYGASLKKYSNVMASNLLMWEAIRFGKQQGCHTFDMWGSLGPDPDKKDPWYGFHRFKEGYGASLVEFVGTWDYVLNQPLYSLYNILDNLRWKCLRLKAKLPF
jgi:lipid II:glycine glycyltransferase (peptidoglycan interpeptide bridge formation enzyme)